MVALDFPTKLSPVSVVRTIRLIFTSYSREGSLHLMSVKERVVDKET